MLNNGVKAGEGIHVSLYPNNISSPFETSSSFFFFFVADLKHRLFSANPQPWIATSGTSQVPPTAALCTHLLLHHRPTLCTTDLRDTLRSVNKAATASRFSLRRRETPRFSTTLLLLLHVSLISNLELLLYDLWLMLVFFCVGYSWIRNQGDSQA